MDRNRVFNPSIESTLLSRARIDHPAVEGLPLEPRDYHFQLSGMLDRDPANGHWYLADKPGIDLGPRMPAWGLGYCLKNAMLDDLHAQGVDAAAVKDIYLAMNDASCRDRAAYDRWILSNRPEGFVSAELNRIAGSIEDARIVAALDRMFEIDERNNNMNSVSSGGTMASSLCSVTRELILSRKALSMRLAELAQPPQADPESLRELQFPPRPPRSAT